MYFISFKDKYDDVKEHEHDNDDNCKDDSICNDCYDGDNK